MGGREATTARVLLRDGDKEYVCIVTHDLARVLGKHLLGPVVRLHGRGRWRRDQDGNWELIDFRATDFDVLDDASLAEAARKLQAAGGFGYRDAAELTDDVAAAPIPPFATSDHNEAARDRIRFLIETLDNARINVVVPTPVLTEILSSSGTRIGWSGANALDTAWSDA